MSPGPENARGEPQMVVVNEADNENKYIAALDVGTTTIRCHVFDQNAQIKGSADDLVELLYPHPGFVEIDPEKLWVTVVEVIKKAIEDAGLTPDNISCLGISVQRSSFTTWNKDTGIPFHNIITWRDVRADKLVHDLNGSVSMKTIKLASKFLYCITRNDRFLAGSQMKLMNTQVTPRLLWVLDNVAPLKEAVAKNKACFGTIDTWLIYKLTGGKLHATDFSNAACTGFFDPFTMEWASWAVHLFGVPANILPKLFDTAGDFGWIAEDVLGTSIPIRSCVADQSASLFGSCAFKRKDMKVTLGTGSFLDVNTGNKPHASISGIYPIVGWKIKDEIVYVSEGASNDTGTTIKWAQAIGLLKDASESSDMAKSVKDTDGVCFIPSFSGIQAPINDGLAAAGFIGIKPTTTKNHLVRAILESIAFRIDQLFEVTENEIGEGYSLIRVDGGVSKNDFLVQLLADLTRTPVERPKSVEVSSLGAAFLAGLSSGIWKSKEDLLKLRKIDRTFQPSVKTKKEFEERIYLWRNAVSRFLHWYPEQEF